MESGCFAVVLFGVAVAALVVAINGSNAATALRAELRQLQARFDALERRLREEVRGSREEVPVPVPVPEPVPEPLPSFSEPLPSSLEPLPSSVEPLPSTPEPPPPPPPPPPAQPPPAPSRPFDWESLVGVKLFSWIAGVALVLAAVFFLKYSVDHGWLSPVVRATLGLLVGSALLVVCEMRIARNYALTANAMHGAGIAILYATLFSIHALWHLLPAAVVFALMLVVTAVAVMLSIRRDSVFIALLGLMGGFATPALLSTTHRPIELFSYLLLLNGGLAWVAYRKRWVALTAGSLLFTVIYQWVWITKFLTVTQLPLAAAIFAVFALAGSSMLWIRGAAREDDEQRKFERVSLVAAILPLTFAVFGAAVPAYGLRYNTLFGFLLFMAAGLAAIARWRGPVWLHALGGAGTLLTFALWIAISYRSTAWPAILGWVAAFVVLYLAAGIRIESKADRTAGVLLFVFPVLAAREPAAANAPLLFGTLFVLLAIVAAYAIRSRAGAVYLIGSFLAIVTQAIWSARHLKQENLLPALLVYAAFGLLFLTVPVIARRVDRPIEPAWGVPATVLLSFGVLFFLTADGVAPAALWGLALLLSLLMIGLFGEARRNGSPAFAVAGVLLGWLVIASWWEASTLAISTIPALFLVALFGIIILLSGARAISPPDGSFAATTHMAIAGHVFLMFLAPQSDLSVPPWPLFAVLALLDLAIGTAALYLRRGTLLIGAGIASQFVAIGWASQARLAPWPDVALALTLVISAFTVVWYVLARRQFDGTEAGPFAQAAGVTLFLGHIAATVAGQASASSLFGTLLLTHAVLAAAILVLARMTGTYVLATLLVPILAFATGLNGVVSPAREFAFAAVIYAIFLAFPLLLGSRARREFQPYLAAVLASVPFFFFARNAMIEARLGNVIGLLPLAQALILLVLATRLVRMEPPSERMLGRLAMVAGAALAFITAAIPLQLDRQWITLGWALEGAALVWLYRRVPHRGLLLWAAALSAAVFVRLVLNPAIFESYARASTPIFNWYLYTYGVCAAAFFASAKLLPAEYRRSIATLTSGATVILFFLLNLEIGDYYSTGSRFAFNFLSASLAQDLTYTIAWALFALAMLIAGIWFQTRGARIAALSLLVITILKCFLHDLGRLGGLYRVGSLLGLAISLVLVGLLLQKFVLRRPAEGTA